jgi:ABC-type nitrate/sulfonate/bicarbonate transport system substrate-binding protein
MPKAKSFGMSTVPNTSLLFAHPDRYRRGRSHRLRLGYVQLSDAAPFMIAEAQGLFQKYGLDVELHRELGWATVRDKIIYGELDAAQALAPMPFSATLGLGIPIARECVAAMTLNVNGDAITLSTRLQEAGVTDENDLRSYVHHLPSEQKLTLGVVSLYSPHHILLRMWLKKIGLEAERDVRIVVIPPAQMLRNLETGNLDGYCVGEPWNGAAVYRKSGWIVATSQTLAPNHPEKVLMMRHDFINNSSADCIRLIAALSEACEYCDAPESREDLIRFLSSENHLDCPEAWLHYGLTATLAHNTPKPSLPLNTLSFHGPSVNEPSAEHARWVIDGLRTCGLLQSEPAHDAMLTSSVCAPEYYHAAIRLRNQTPVAAPAVAAVS